MSPKLKITDLTVYTFVREHAKLGSFLGRKHDGEPGWGGYQKLHQTSVGIALA